MALKPSKPVIFDDTDVTHTLVRNWMFSIQEYMDLAEVPENKRTRLMGTYLSGIAKSWYINKYADVTPLPSLADFLANFKKHHTHTDNAVTVIRRIETMKQGHRPAADYETEFESLVTELGNTDTRWVHEHFLWGLDDATHIALAPALLGDEDLDSLIARANNVSRALKQARPHTTTTHTMTHAPASSSQPSQSNFSSSPSAPANLKKLTEMEREYLHNNRGCFRCRKTNVDHIASTCPETSGGKPSTPVIKKEAAIDAIVTLDIAGNEYNGAYLHPNHV